MDGGRSSAEVEERCKVLEEFRFFDAKIVVEKVEQLAFHQVGLGLGEEGGISRPVLVLWRRVIQVLCSDDENSKEDAMSGARHAFCCRWESRTQTLEVDKRAKQSGDLNVALRNKDGDESFK